MIRTLSKALSNGSSQESSPPSHSRRSTFHSLARRLSESKKTFLEQIPHHQEQLIRLRKRTKSLFTSPFDSDQRRSSFSVSGMAPLRDKTTPKKKKPPVDKTEMFNYLFRSLVWMKSIDALMLHMQIILQ